MTADDIKALLERLRKHRETGICMEGTVHLAEKAADAIDELTQDIEDLKHDNASMLDSLTKESTARCEAEDALAALTLENQRLRVDAERYQFIKSKTKTFSLDMGGQHTYCIDFSIARLRGPSLDAAVDGARSQSDKEKPV